MTSQLKELYTDKTPSLCCGKGSETLMQLNSSQAECPISRGCRVKSKTYVTMPEIEKMRNFGLSLEKEFKNWTPKEIGQFKSLPISQPTYKGMIHLINIGNQHLKSVKRSCRQANVFVHIGPPSVPQKYGVGVYLVHGQDVSANIRARRAITDGYTEQAKRLKKADIRSSDQNSDGYIFAMIDGHWVWFNGLPAILQARRLGFNRLLPTLWRK